MKAALSARRLHPTLHCPGERCASLGLARSATEAVMRSFRLNARRPIDPPADDGFEVSYVPDDGAVHRMPLARAWEMPLERSLPVRRFTSRKGQRHLSGLWWSATTGGHVGFESWLETRSCAASGFRPVRGRHCVAAVVAALDRRRGALLLPNPAGRTSTSSIKS